MTSQLVSPTGVDLEGVPKRSAQVAWAGDVVSLQPSTRRSWIGTVLLHCVLQEKVFRICFCHQARWQSGPARQNRAREAHNNMFGQTILISQILVSRQAVEKSEVSELDADLVVADAPQVVVDRLGPRSSSHRVEPCSASHLEPPRSPFPRSHSLGACS